MPVGSIVHAAVTILVDAAIWPWKGRRWAHLVSDRSYDELHAFASDLGIPRTGFQGDHYDIPASFREMAITKGATPVEGRELVRRLRDAGLRLSPTQRRQFPREVVPRLGCQGRLGSVGDEQT